MPTVEEYVAQVVKAKQSQNGLTNTEIEEADVILEQTFDNDEVRVSNESGTNILIVKSPELP